MTESHGDAYWMRRALALARLGLGTTAPNPMVGAIVLNASGRLVGQGFHRRAGEAHAEAVALEQAGAHARQGTLYVTLEPCAHQGRTPPCSERIIQAGVKRVVIAGEDPNPLVHQKGIEQMRGAGIEIENHCLSVQADRLNAGFRNWIAKKRPLFTAKVALSSDGYIGARTERVILSAPPTVSTTMRLRAEAGAIVVGADTILTDDPLLTVRGRWKHRKPIRAVLDGRLRTPPTANLFTNPGGEVWIFTETSRQGSEEARALQKRGARLIFLDPASDGRLPLAAVTRKFSENDMTAVLVEGGKTLLEAFVRENWIDRWVFFFTPTILEGRFAPKDLVSFPGVGPFPLRFQSVIRRGPDWEAWALRDKPE